MVEFYVKITYMKPRTMMTYSTQTAITSIVKQTAEYPNRLKNVIRNPKPTNNMTWMSKITKQDLELFIAHFHEKIMIHLLPQWWSITSSAECDVESSCFLKKVPKFRGTRNERFQKNIFTSQKLTINLIHLYIGQKRKIKQQRQFV